MYNKYPQLTFVIKNLKKTVSYTQIITVFEVNMIGLKLQTEEKKCRELLFFLKKDILK